VVEEELARQSSSERAQREREDRLAKMRQVYTLEGAGLEKDCPVFSWLCFVISVVRSKIFWVLGRRARVRKGAITGAADCSGTGWMMDKETVSDTAMI
jgi:hypothetical protein